MHSTHSSIRRTFPILDPFSMKAAVKALVAWRMVGDPGFDEKALQSIPASSSDSLESLCQTCPSDSAALIPLEDAVERLDQILQHIIHTTHQTAIHRNPNHANSTSLSAHIHPITQDRGHLLPQLEFSSRTRAKASSASSSFPAATATLPHTGTTPSPVVMPPHPLPPHPDPIAPRRHARLRWGDPADAADGDAGLLERRARELCFGLPAGSPAERAVLQGLQLRCQVSVEVERGRERRE